MLSIDLLVAVDYLKFDRRWVSLLRQQNYQVLFQNLLGFARATGRITILEGIETEQELERVQQFPLDYIQGFLFKERFIQSDMFPL